MPPGPGVSCQQLDGTRGARSGDDLWRTARPSRPEGQAEAGAADTRTDAAASFDEGGELGAAVVAAGAVAPDPPPPSAVLAPLLHLSRTAEADAALLVASGSWRVYGEDEVLCEQGEVSEALFLVAPGHGSVLVEVEVGHVAGAIPSLLTGQHGGLVGAASLLTRAPCSYTVCADERSWVLAIDRTAIRHLSTQHPHLLIRLQQMALLQEPLNTRRLRVMSRLWLAGGWSGANFDQVTVRAAQASSRSTRERACSKEKPRSDPLAGLPAAEFGPGTRSAAADPAICDEAGGADSVFGTLWSVAPGEDQPSISDALQEHAQMLRRFAVDITGRQSSISDMAARWGRVLEQLHAEHPGAESEALEAHRYVVSAPPARSPARRFSAAPSDCASPSWYQQPTRRQADGEGSPKPPHMLP